MSFRLRLIVVSALAVTTAIAIVSVTVYMLEANQLNSDLRHSLEDRTAQATSPLPQIVVLPDHPPPCYTNVTTKLVNVLQGYFQTIDEKGTVLAAQGRSNLAVLPVTKRDIAVAKTQTGAFFHNTSILVSKGRSRHWQRVSIYTSPFAPDCALQVARSLTSNDQSLRRLRVALLVVSLGGIGLAVVLGWIVAGTALRPVRQLTRTSERVARTRDLSHRIETKGRDELARLANAFNTMLEALDFSLKAQRQLVADASHELRTPLTTAKTNVEVLRRAELPKEERDTILREVGEQIEELAVLITDIVDLARGVEPNLEVEDVRLDLLVEQAVERARRLSPKNVFKLETTPCMVRGVPSRLERAVANLLDNACKWSPLDVPIEVVVKDGEVSVRDHGQGIDAEDLPFIFDRFYRAPSARALPGSGLGLAIVRQVAESHGGQVAVELPEDGGALLRIVLPGAEDV
ncbi:MAG: HAMP domain-containing sensor histidine kinase [Gaiellaceae bacterium]|jgi:two-component system sensor histidine kinase MprB